MKQLELFLKIMNEANLATPTIVGIVNTIRAGRAAGKTDADIQEESMRIALDTRAQTEQDMSPDA